MNYLWMFCQPLQKVCKPVQRLTSAKANRTWNNIYKEIYGKTKGIMKDDICMKFCSEIELLYLETDALG